MLILGEVALAMGNASRAKQRLQWVCTTNPRSVGAWYLRGYIAWKSGYSGQARQMLQRARAARGKEWKPFGSVMEGDVHRRMHAEAAFLSPYWEQWDGAPEPAKAFKSLSAFLVFR